MKCYIVFSGLIVVCSMFGIATSKADDSIRLPFVSFFSSVAELVMIVLRWIVWYVIKIYSTTHVCVNSAILHVVDVIVKENMHMNPLQ